MKKLILFAIIVIFALFSLFSACQARIISTDTCCPDGRVYWSSDPPYAYTPTYSRKRWSLPIMPLISLHELLRDLIYFGELARTFK